MRVLISTALAGISFLSLAACSDVEAAQPSEIEDGANGLVETLPLTLGFYVRAEDSCARASNATLLLLHREGFNSSREPCNFKLIRQVNSNRFHVTQSCSDNGAAWGRETETYEANTLVEVTNEGSFRSSWDDGATWQDMTYCPQSSLPEPWRDNDLSDLISE